MSDTLKIPKMAGPEKRVWRCSRCDTVLSEPVEKTAVYVHDTRANIQMLVCPKCVREGDLYIWGNKGVL